MMALYLAHNFSAVIPANAGAQLAGAAEIGFLMQ
jgi:hypothetical protein